MHVITRTLENIIKLDDSNTSYITEICYFEYLLSLGLQNKTFFTQVKTFKYKTLIKFLAPTLDFFSKDPPIQMKS